MEKIEEFTDQRNQAWCIHCGRWIAGLEINRDHAPSRSLLRKPYPPNLPQVPICKPCNEGFSLDEEYLSVLLGCVLSGSSDPDCQSDPRVSRALTRSSKLRARLDRAKTVYKTRSGESRLVWTAETERISRVVLKNARAHAFFEFGEPMLPEPECVCVLPLENLTREQREEFDEADMGHLLPEVGSRMLTRVLTGQDLYGSWIIVQDGTYRYAVAQHGCMRVRSVIAEYLATEVYWSDT